MFALAERAVFYGHVTRAKSMVMRALPVLLRGGGSGWVHGLAEVVGIAPPAASVIPRQQQQQQQQQQQHYQQQQQQQCAGTQGEHQRWSLQIGPSVRSRIPEHPQQPHWPRFSPAAPPPSSPPPLSLSLWISQCEETKTCLKFLRASEQQGGAFDDWVEKEKVKVNALHLSVNSEAFAREREVGKKLGVPRMWLRVCRRTEPLSSMLNALGRVQGVARSELFVSVDCRDWDAVLRVLANVTFTTVRVYFHSLVNDAQQLGFPRTESGGTQFHQVIKLNSHYLWGLYLMFVINTHDYVITLEDDLEPSRDFLLWHTHMRPVLLKRREFFAVLSHPHGPVHDCSFIGSPRPQT
jgi:hypothetical protein